MALWTPQPRTTPDRWGAQNRSYPPSSGLPGPRNPALTPYTIQWARAVARGDCKIGVLVTSTQSGKTDTVLDIIGERLDRRPAPILYVGPSKDFNTDQFEPRLMSLLDEAPTLAGKVARGKRMKKTRKVIAGVPVRLAHAGSSTALKSDPAALAIVDEYDEMLKNVKGQGDPLGLVKHRGDTYADFVIAVTSTPSRGAAEVQRDPDTNLEFWAPIDPSDLESPIWKIWQEGSRHHWAWPCPQCGEYFIPRFSCLKWQSRDDGVKTTPAEARATAYVECPHCHGVIEDAHKAAMNERGVFVAPGQAVASDGTVIGDIADNSTLSFWVSGLASPFVTFGERAEEYLTAVRMGDQDRIQTVVNAGFGELFASAGGEVPEWAEVRERAGDYALGDMPNDVIAPILTVDVQKSRLVWVARGWGARATSWLIDRGSLYGETVEEAVWTDLAEMISQPICGVPYRLVLIDSGFRPGKRDDLPLNRVYDFCRRFPRVVRPTKGASRPQRIPLVASKIEVTTKGKAAKYGLDLLLLDTDHWKSWVHERIRWPGDQPGAWHLPHDIDDDYCRQIIAEARVRRPSGRHQWVQRSKENHFLDLEAMQAAAAYLLNFQRVGEGARRPVIREAVPQAQRPAAPQRPAQQPGGGWLIPGNNWL